MSDQGSVSNASSLDNIKRDEEDITSEHLLEREREQSETAEHAVLPAAKEKAQRRADKAGYLAEKLAEQERADRE